MKKINKMKKLIAIAMTITMMLSVAGCGKNQEVIQDVAEMVAEETEAAEVEVTEIETVDLDEMAEKEAEEPETTEEPETLTYVAENGLEYTEATLVNTHGKLMDTDNRSDYILGDVTFQLGGLSIFEGEEEGFKTVVVEQVVSGYRWSDGENYKTFVSFPTLFVADAYTGIIVPNETTSYNMTSGVHRAEIEWEGKTYPISYYETTEWVDSNKWEKVEGGDLIWQCAALDTLFITIPDGYDGLALLLPSILVTKEYTESGEHIMDYWTDEDCYLFKVYIDDVEDEEAEVSETASPVVTNNNKVVKTEADSTPTTTPKQEETKAQTVKEEVKPAHTHSYASSVTANPTCSSTGTKTFTCSCGDSYTESIPQTEHSWVERREIIHHESTGHMESTSREVTTFYCRGCGGAFGSVDEFRHHDAGDCGASSYYWTTETIYDNVWVVDSDAFDSEEVVGYTCSNCGATK